MKAHFCLAGLMTAILCLAVPLCSEEISMQNASAKTSAASTRADARSRALDGDGHPLGGRSTPRGPCRRIDDHHRSRGARAEAGTGHAEAQESFRKRVMAMSTLALSAALIADQFLADRTSVFQE